MTVSDEARRLLADCARQFRHYEELHRAKGTPEAYEKSKANGAFAHRIECFLSAGVDYESQRPSPHDEGERVFRAGYEACQRDEDKPGYAIGLDPAGDAWEEYRESAPKLDEGVIAEVKELRELLAKVNAFCPHKHGTAQAVAWNDRRLANNERIIARVPRLLTRLEGGGK